MRQSLVERDEDHSDTLIILQHQPVYTLGTRSLEKFLKFDVKNAPYDLYQTERGGEVTYHGPGQLIMYPILNLRCHKMDTHWYLRSLEEIVIRTLFTTFSVKASRIEGLTGVWVGMRALLVIILCFVTFHSQLLLCNRLRGSSCSVQKMVNLQKQVMRLTSPFQNIFSETQRLCFSYLFPGNKKLAAVGVRVSRWITYHGLALNVTTDLAPFQHIVPCGIQDREVGTLSQILWGSAKKGTAENKYLMDVIHDSLLKEFSELFQLSIEHKTIADLELLE